MKMRLNILILLFTLLSLSFVSSTALADTVNLKKGEWIEYQVLAIGDFPGEHNVNWTRIEIIDVRGEIILLNVTVQLTTGPYVYYNDTVDFEKGELMEGFFLPSNVTDGDVFFDKLVGNITVSGVEHRTYGGADRTLVVGVAPETTYYWDKAKGIMVEAHSSYPSFNYTVDTIAEKTNMWQAQILGLDPTVFYAITVGIVALTTIIAVFLTYRLKKKP